jgi:hypothetical protein
MQTNAEAVASTLAALQRMGRLEDIDAASVQAVKALSAAVDLDPMNASLWREYRAALKDLIEEKDAGIDEFEQLLAQLRAPVRDTP